MSAKRFVTLAEAQHGVAEVLAVEEFIITTTTVEGIGRYRRVLFDNDAEGFVWQIQEQSMKILVLRGELPDVGSMVVDSGKELGTEVSSSLLGRVLNPLLEPLDNEPEVIAHKTRKLFAQAPGFAKRQLLSEQLETGVCLVDMLFPIVKGQRIAVIGDAKSGKTSLLLQTAVHQASLGSIVVLVLIAKRASDVREQLQFLKESGQSKNMVIIIADSQDYLPLSYIAPYVAASIGEAFWYGGRDVVLLYDDLTHHAKLYREMSLRLSIPAGREGYPGDMFYIHSSLLERAGKLADSEASLTILAVGTTANGDITSYLSTSLISMTDGQFIFDLESLHRGRKPAINIGLSVSRVGGRAQTAGQQQLTRNIITALSNARTAEQFSRFGGQASRTVLTQIELSNRLEEAFEQGLNQSYSILEQRLLLSAIFHAKEPASISVPWLKTVISDVAKQPVKEEDIEDLAAELSRSKPEGGTHV